MDKIVLEAPKTIMICNSCHRAIHSNVYNGAVPSSNFNEKIYRITYPALLSEQKTVKHPTKEEVIERLPYMSMNAIGREFGIPHASIIYMIRKQYKLDPDDYGGTFIGKGVRKSKK